MRSSFCRTPWDGLPNSAGVRDGTTIMRTVLRILGVLLAFVGAVWFLQGVNVLPGSFMTGQTKWAIYGGIAFVAGVVAFVVANRKKAAAS